MPVITCPNGHRLQVGDRQIGQTIKCPTCQASFVASAEEQSLEFGDADKGSSPSAGGGVKREPQASYITSLINAFVGKPLLFVGLVLAILGRGCDATGSRSVSRSDAQYRQAKIAFQLDWDGKMSASQQKVEKKNREINDLRKTQDKKGGGDEFFKQMDALQKERNALDEDLNKLRSDQVSEQLEKENKEWKAPRETALSAANHHRMWVYWYELLFIFGTILLVLGILTLAFTGQGAERWIAYIMIAIITFSIFVFGAAWIGSFGIDSGSGQVAQPPLLRDR